MKKYIRWIRQNINAIYRVLLFIFALGVLSIIYPNIGNFRYEYQKGKPWMHETLIAPFDFAIHKTEAELNENKDSLLANYYPYYQYKPEVLEEIKNQFNSNFEKKWNTYIKTENFKKLNYKKNKVAIEKKRLLLYFHDIISGIYEIGIIEDSNTKNQLPEKINRSSNNVSEKVETKSLYTSKIAYEYISQSIKNDFKNQSYHIFFQNLNLDTYLTPNLLYNEDMSEKVKNSMLSNISLTKGLVKSGTRIALIGDIIDDDTFRILESLKREYESILGSSQSHYLIMGGQSLLILACLVLLFLYLRNFRTQILEDNKKLLFILLLIILFVGLSSLLIKFPKFNIYIIPFVLIPIVLRTLLDSRSALFIFIISLLLCGFLAPNSFEFLFLQLSAGIMSIYSLPQLERRGQLVITAIITFFTYSIVYFAFAITQEGSIQEIEWKNFLWFAINGLLLTFSYSLIYIFEKLFGFISDVTLIELSNQNHPVLRQLIQHSPGTFQHSLTVANLAEAAINEIGGNPLLVRTGALYHDIGKMKNPIYFIENQMSNRNPHDNLEFDKSAQIITDHVKYGVKIAKKHKLPQQIIDFIQTHHGAGRVQYFYTSFKNKYPDKEIDEEKFTYPGPDPFSKETAVLMMADSVEAASRSLKEKTPEAIENLVINLINKQIAENRFEMADISFKNIHQVKHIFTQMLINIYHARIEYPEEIKRD
ncbi:HDIG domain-containing protein [Ancylomarina euxinus]|uniref:HDIG domain-containing protein n=1 Tax=Ancylomarina euxinus TaxID=2283627 RepID=A0A425XWY0_9BACT|nr:HDIG domain-containing metalloprotein [Ancylomarina euxinus]MCZ4696294.1 HDIG domain-containing protein [Ancylomarina euxinus]MUP16676.1 HDIG domain-containing protein [Ancylomarina euxinus]RRG19150.1 HDIG domain-containing protein [Ancylomarina euxinus]